MEAFVWKHGKAGEGFSQKEINRSFEHPGRRTDGSQSAASWIGDIGERKQCIILCSFCRAKFNPRKHHYRKYYVMDITGRTDGHAVNGKCDDCKQFTANLGGGTAFIHEAFYSQICTDPTDARRQQRAAAGRFSVSRFLGIRS